MDLEQSPFGADRSLHVDERMKYRVPVRDLAPELFQVCPLRPVHDLAGDALGVYQNDVEHIVADGV